MKRPGRGTAWVAAVGIAVVAIGGATLAAGASTAPPGDDVAVTARPHQRGWAGGLQNPREAATPASRAGQTASRVTIPVIGVDSTLEHLPLDPATGALVPPTAWMSAGWYKDGTVPGDLGPAVIAGHVDSATGPAVFARIEQLVAGDEIHVTLSTGEVVDFVVDKKIAAPKDAFPTDLVYGPTPTAALRLITCDGVFDRSTGHYTDNLIVFASPRG
jgi:LPXTG-site transpeptidase (sortase) family protein